MDPLSIIGVTAAITQIIQAIYTYGASVRSAKSEINQLCSELLALKAALEHIHLNRNSNVDSLSTSMETLDLSKEAQHVLSTSNYDTPEFQQMFANAQQIVQDLLTRLQQQRKPGKFHTAKQGMLWHFLKEEIRRDIERLNRLRGFFILASTTDNTVVCRESYAKICAIDGRLRDQEEREERRERERLRGVVRGWVAPFEPQGFYRSALEGFQEGTGEWFLEDVFAKWLSLGPIGDPPLLWLHARPGSGKTTLLSAAIRHAQELSSSTIVAFFYCSFTDKDSQNLQNILGSFLVQLYDNDTELWGGVESQYVNRKGNSIHDPKKLEIEILRDLIVYVASLNQKRSIILFLDALNESNQSVQALSTLHSLTRDCPNIRIMISSTEEIIPTLPSDEHLLVSMESNRKDISKLISARISDDSRLRSLPPSLKDSIQTTLERDSDGIFRWAECQLSTLADQPSAHSIKLALDHVPLTLEQTYASILARIPPPQTHIAKQTLFWVAFALKPMTLQELSEAILITSSPSTVIDPTTRLLRDSILLKACASLLSYSHTTTTITLAHSSVYTYLTSPDLHYSPDPATAYYHLNPHTANNDITTRCITYLLLPPFAEGACPTYDLLDARLQQWPLLRYVAETLFAHLAYITLDSAMTALLLRFFRTHDSPPHNGGGGAFGSWVQAFLPQTTSNIADSTPLYYAARYGLLPIVQLILSTEDGRATLERRGGVYHSTPLHVAAWLGRTDVVRELLRAGADAREVNDEGKPGLVWAVVFGFGEIEALLRKAGARLEGGVERAVRREGGWEIEGEEEEEEEGDEEEML